jgi:hypothetical protein
MPKGAQPRIFGVVDEPVPDGFLPQLAYPLRRRRTEAARA